MSPATKQRMLNLSRVYGILPESQLKGLTGDQIESVVEFAWLQFHGQKLRHMAIKQFSFGRYTEATTMMETHRLAVNETATRRIEEFLKQNKRMGTKVVPQFFSLTTEYQNAISD